LNKAVQYVVMGVAIVAAFAAGNFVMKLWQSSGEEAKEAAAMVAQIRPDFKLPDLQGNVRDIAEWDGQVVVLNFWATWCPPCKKEMPAFIELQEQFGLQGLQFVGVALDDAIKVENFIETMGVEYPILLGGDEALAVSAQYGNSFGALPYTVVIGRTGEIVSTYRGEVTKKQIELDIKKVL